MQKRSAVEWQAVVEQWRGSGLTRSAFSVKHGVHPTTLSWWAWRLGSSAPAGRTAPAFVEVVAAGGSSDRALKFVVEVRDVRVHVPVGFDASELRRLVGALC